jgi:hypothetical protein
VDVEQLLDQKLQQMPGMTLGQLDNGLRYVILPNKVPPNRFEAHLEMHVGETRVLCPAAVTNVQLRMLTALRICSHLHSCCC